MINPTQIVRHLQPVAYSFPSPFPSVNDNVNGTAERGTGKKWPLRSETTPRQMNVTHTALMDK